MHEVRCSIQLWCSFSFFSCPFFHSFCLFSFIYFALFYLQLPHYLFTRNHFPLHVTQPNRTNFSFSNSRTLVNQLVDHWSCAMASFWDFKIICAPSIISKAVHVNLHTYLTKVITRKNMFRWNIGYMYDLVIYLLIWFLYRPIYIFNIYFCIYLLILLKNLIFPFI